MRVPTILCFAVIVACGDATQNSPSDSDATGTEGSTETTAAGGCTDIATPPADAQIIIDGAGTEGMYDMSMVADPDGTRIWMSYTSVGSVTSMGTTFKSLDTRLATSDDCGATWIDRGVVVNETVVDPPVPMNYMGLPAAWLHEVSNLTYDANAPEAERWKLMWHRYLHVEDGELPMGDERKVEYSWIGFKTAATPDALASAEERMLFSGLAWDVATDTAWTAANLGTPEVPLHQLPSDVGGELATCAAFTEPGLLATETGLYLSIVCLLPTGAPRVALIRWTESAAQWEFVGMLLDSAADADLAGAHVGFSASELFATEDETYLIASGQLGEGLYTGCAVFVFDDLSTASLRDADNSGAADVVGQVLPTHGGRNPGACGYAPASVHTGLTYGEVFPLETPFARQYRSLLNF